MAMSRIYVGNVDSRATEQDLEDEFRKYGVLRSVWVACKPPGFAFVEFEDQRDAGDAIRGLNGKNGWRVELSRSSGGGGPRGRGGGSGGRGGDDMKCYECGEAGHFARECRLRVGPGGHGSGDGARSRSPRYRRSSPTYGRSGHSPRSRSPGAYGSKRNRSPVGVRPSHSSQRERSLSQSPPPRRQNFKESPPANGSPRERRNNRSVSP